MKIYQGGVLNRCVNKYLIGTKNTARNVTISSQQGKVLMEKASKITQVLSTNKHKGTYLLFSGTLPSAKSCFLTYYIPSTRTH